MVDKIIFRESTQKESTQILWNGREYLPQFSDPDWNTSWIDQGNENKEKKEEEK